MACKQPGGGKHHHLQRRHQRLRKGWKVSALFATHRWHVKEPEKKSATHTEKHKKERESAKHTEKKELLGTASNCLERACSKHWRSDKKNDRPNTCFELLRTAWNEPVPNIPLGKKEKRERQKRKKHKNNKKLENQPKKAKKKQQKMKTKKQRKKGLSAAQRGNLLTFVGRSSAQRGNLLTSVVRSSAQRSTETC
jgi:hypothetical protein